MYRCASLISVICIFLSSVNLFAQRPTGGAITGSIVAKATHQPLENVSVVVFAQDDSAMVSGTMTDAKGRFVVDHIPDGNYYAVFSCIGYAEINSGAFPIDSQHLKKDIGTLSMTETAVILKGTVVTGEKKAFINSIDRKIYTIEKDVMGQAGSTCELLQNIPSVSVDIDGNVSMRGTSNVLKLINGRT